MSKKSFIDSVKVKSPCTEDWEQMQGNERVRFCSHCSKSVNNLSEMTRKEAIRLVRASGGNLCIRFVANPVTKRPLFADQLLQITRRTPTLAAGVMTASIALSTQVWAQGGAAPETPAVIEQKVRQQETAQSAEKDATKSGSISGAVKDQNGAVIPGIAIELTNGSTGEKRGMASDADGNYKFDDLADGSYEVLFKAAMGFAEKQVVNVRVTAEKETILDAEMTAGAVMGEIIVGGLAISEETEYKTPLALAVRNEDIDEVRDLIAKGENVNEKEEDKTTPLFAAVESGNIEIVQMLLDQGAKVNARDKEKQTPLMRLDEDATHELIGLLIRYGAKLDLTDKEGDTALILAVGRSVTAEVVKALIDAGANVNLANKTGRTALINAADNSNIENARSLIEAGADVNAKDKSSETAWDKTGDDEIEKLLESHGAIIDDEPETETNEASEPAE